MDLTINRDLFRKHIKRIVAKHIRHAVPWREYVLGWGGVVRELECTTAVSSFKPSVDVVCREVVGAREYTLKPIIVIENDNGVVTVLVGD